MSATDARWAWLVLVPLGLLSAQPAATAQPGEGFTPRFEVIPWGGYRFGGDFDYGEEGAQADPVSIDLRDAASWGIDLGLYRDAESFYELLYSSQSTRLDTQSAPGPLRLRTEYYHIGGTLLFPRDNGIVPWFSFTAGVTRFGPRGTIEGAMLSSESAFSIGAGAGLRLPLNAHVAVLGGVRGYFSFIDSDSSLFCVSSGGAACAFAISGSSFLQVEGLLGVALTF